MKTENKKYKDSGVDWIGIIPNDWCVEKGKHIFAQRNTKGNESPVLLAATQKSGMIPQSLLEGVVQVKLDTDLQTFKTVHIGDFVISLRSFQGGFEMSDYEGVCSPAYQVFYNTQSIFHKYYKYLFKSYGFISKMNSLVVGIREGKNIQYKDFAESMLPVPPLPTQQRIADFLDRKCAEIDKLAALQETMIAELKRYKQSVITEAVTKGLDKNVKMKDSGVEWIGEIPSHSNLSRIGNLIKDYKAGPFGSSLITGNLLTEGTILVYTPEHIAKLTTNIEGNLFLQEERLEEMSQFIVHTGDIIFPIVGSLGRAMEVTSEMPIGIINQRLSKFSLQKGKIDARYFMWVFGKSEFYNPYIEVNCRGAIIVNLTKEIVRRMPIVCHSLAEQRAIADYLDRKCAEIDELIAIKQQKIEQLKEYKKSVIFEYVTGKKEVEK